MTRLVLMIGISLAWVTQVERLPSGNTRLVNCQAACLQNACFPAGSKYR